MVISKDKTLKKWKDIEMPTKKTGKNSKEEIIENVLMKKLQIEISSSTIDKNIVRAASKLTTPKVDLLSISHISRFENPKSSRVIC